ncbi:hypothetical protein ABZ702_03905 [Streptomyces cyaneofuscatus]|uniref:hypothetical protein n=1 Tax=Streptomyces cyaneofuscatus TaxID=66883 RepID=UPI0033F25607
MPTGPGAAGRGLGQRLPATLDVTVDHGPAYGVSEVFDIAEVRRAVVPPGGVLDP